MEFNHGGAGLKILLKAWEMAKMQYADVQATARIPT
jgi:hypothetical protein